MTPRAAARCTLQAPRSVRPVAFAVAVALAAGFVPSHGAATVGGEVSRSFSVGAGRPVARSFEASGASEDRFAEIARREDLQELRGLEVTRLRIEGLPGNLADPLRRGLELAGVNTLLGHERARFYAPNLARDLERARLFLAREGYPQAEVDVEAKRTKEDGVDLLVRIAPGRATRITRVELRGFPGGIAREGRDWVGLEAGARFRDAALEAAVLLGEARLRDEGYARCGVAAEVVPLATGDVEVKVAADPGPRCSFREIRIEGTSPDLVRLARRTVGISGGDRYAARRVIRAEEQLRLLGLFRQIRVGIEEAPGFDRTAPEGEVDLVVQLGDRPPRSLETGVGYWSEDLLRVQARWQHRNLLRRGRGLETSGLFSKPRREVETSVWWPALFRSDLRGQLAGRFAWQFEESFRARRRGGDLAFLYRPTVRSTIRIGLEIERVTIVELGAESSGESRETQLRLAGQWSFDNTDDRLDPSRGQLVTLAARAVLPTELAQTEFAVYEVGLSQYLRLVPRTVLALRGNAGWAAAAAGELPAIYRFFGGGATSMRGYRRGRLGPIDATNTPTGGEAKLELGGEVRFPIWKGLRGAGFLDAAQVWTDRSSVDLADLEQAAGFGFVWSSPVGPVRLDFGFPLETPPAASGDPSWVLHVLVGHPF